MLELGFIQPAQRRRMPWVLAQCSDGSMQRVTCTSVSLHCASAHIMTQFASLHAEILEDSPSLPCAMQAGRDTLLLCFAGGESEAALACPQNYIAQPWFWDDLVKPIHKTMGLSSTPG